MLVHTVPTEGLAHPVFAGMGPGDNLIVVLQFRDTLDDATNDRVWAGIQEWERTQPRVDAQASLFSGEPWSSKRTLRVRLQNLPDLRAAAEALQARVEADGVVVKERFYARWAQLPGQQIWGPVRNPDAPEEDSGFDDGDSYMKAVFSGGPPPASEYAHELKGAFERSDRNLVLEDRGMPLYIPGLRICYGISPAGFTSPDARAGEVAAAVVRALDEGFADVYYPPNAEPWRPVPFDHTGSCGKVDRLDDHGRIGYGFAVSSNDLMNVYTGESFRFREAELMTALAKVIAEMKLASIITWQRFGQQLMGPLRKVQNHVLQLWELRL